LNFCTYLKNYLFEKLDINTYLSCRRPKNNNNNRTLTISGTQQSLKFLEWIYNGTDSHDLYLKRKHEKYEKIKAILKERDIKRRSLGWHNTKHIVFA